MKRKLLLGSCIHKVIGKVGFLFEKPLHQLNVICITTAANVYAAENKAWLYEEMQGFIGMGIKLNEFDIEGKTFEEVEKTIQNADVVYVTGGNTYYLMEHMQKCDFKTAIIPYLQAGGFYIGSSAGTLVACPTVDFIRDMDDPAKANLTDNRGLGLVDLSIMPHIDHPKYGPKANAIIEDQKNNPDMTFLGLRDDQAVLIKDNYIGMY